MMDTSEAGRARALGLGALLLTFAACGGSDGDGGGGTQPTPPGAPTATITFPPDGVLTEADEITVRGSAASDVGVASVRVNSVDAQSSDGFATWTATVPLSAGDNALVVRATDLDGLTNNSAATADVRREDVLLVEPVGVFADQINNVALVVDSGLRAVVSVALASGSRTVLTGLGVGSGPEPDTPRGITRINAFGLSLVADAGAQALTLVADDGSRTTLSGTPPAPFQPDDVTLGISLAEVYASAPAQQTLYAVSTVDGTRRPLSGPGVGTGPAFGLPAGLILDTLALRLLVVDVEARTLFGVNIGNGQRVVVSNDGLGGGPVFQEPRELAFDFFTYRALVVDPGRDRRNVTEVQLTSGFRSELSGPSNGSGPAFLRPVDISFFSSANTLVVVDAGLDAVVGVNPQTGARTLVSASGAGDGPALDRARGMDREGEGGSLLLADAARPALLRVSVSTGNRSAVSGSGTGAGPQLEAPVDVAWVSDSTALVVDQALGAVLTVELANGARALLSGGGAGSGPALVDPVAIDHLPGSNQAVVVDASGALYSISLTGGARTELSGPNVGGGDPFVRPIALTLDESGLDALVLDEGADKLFAVSLVTGQRTVVSDEMDGDGVTGAAFADLAWDPPGNRALVADPSIGALLEIDLGSGARTPLSTADDPGPRFVEPASLLLDDRGTAWVSDAARGAVMVSVLATGERVVRSK